MPFIRRHRKANPKNTNTSLSKNTSPKQGQDKQKKGKSLLLKFILKRRASSSSSSSSSSQQKKRKARNEAAQEMEDWRDLSPDEPPLPFLINRGISSTTCLQLSPQQQQFANTDDTAFSETNRITSDAAPILKDAAFLFDSEAFSFTRQEYQPTKSFANYCGRELYIIPETQNEEEEEADTAVDNIKPMPVPTHVHHTSTDGYRIKSYHDICDPSSSTACNGLYLDDNLNESPLQPGCNGPKEEKQEIEEEEEEDDDDDDILEDKQEISKTSQINSSNHSSGSGLILVESDDDDDDEDSGHPYLHVPISYWPTKGRYYEPYIKQSLHYNELSCKMKFAKMVTAAYQYYQHHHFQIYDQPKEMHILFNQRDYIRGISFIMYDESRDDFLDFGGSPQYIAPELSVNPRFNPEKADIWALGITLYRMLIGRYPFLDNEGDYFISHKELFKKMLKSDFEIPRETISAEARDLLQRILAPANIRASFDLIMFHPWLKSFIDFSTITRSSTASNIPDQISVKKQMVNNSISSSVRRSYYHTAADTDINVRRRRHKKQPPKPRAYPLEDEHYFGFKRKKSLSSLSSFHILPTKAEAARKLKKLSNTVQKAFKYVVKGPYPPPSNIQDLVLDHTCQRHHQQQVNKKRRTGD